MCAFKKCEPVDIWHLSFINGLDDKLTIKNIYIFLLDVCHRLILLPE